jgi:hypothetical protein
MTTIRKANWLAGLGIAAALALTPAFSLAQSTVTSQTTTTTLSGVNPNDPVQFPPHQGSHEGAVSAAYVDQQIAMAKSRGQDTSAAESQEVMGQTALRNGLDDEAAQHFDNALRSIGVMPSWPGHNPGEAGSYHPSMP